MTKVSSIQIVAGFLTGIVVTCAFLSGRAVFAQPAPVATAATVVTAAPLPAPPLLGGYYFKIRKPGKPDFTDQDKVVEVEVYEDVARDTVLYITESGIAAVPMKH